MLSIPGRPDSINAVRAHEAGRPFARNGRPDSPLPADGYSALAICMPIRDRKRLAFSTGIRMFAARPWIDL